MTLAAGVRLGAYEIRSPLGEGGMGEVWRARDTKLGRDVAVKVLPPDLAASADALDRFEREASAVAKLSHPNILAIHDFGRDGDVAYAVLELLEGETLRQRLAHGPLPARKVADLAAQIADALAAAHEKGIVHRDLKPENVFVTNEGRVKLLDFGLAKLAESAPPVDSALKTVEPHTSPGTILGTVRYMSPEQVRGETTDHRSDLFSFGAVVCEMLTGRAAFGRGSAAECMAAILKEDPHGLTDAATSSPSLVRIVEHCLEKKPGERFQSAQDVAFALQALSGSGAASSPAEAPPRRRRRPGTALFAVAVLLVLAGAFAALWQRAAGRLAEESGRVARLQLAPAKGERVFSAGGWIQDLRSVAISPDGRTIAWVAAKGATSEVRVRALDASESVAIPGTDGAQHPFFSPDGKWIAFNTGVNLEKVALSGGRPITLCGTFSFRGGAWGDDGWIYFVPNMYVPVHRVPADGGRPEAVTKIATEAGEQQHRWPEILPGGKVLLYAVGSGGEWDDATIVAQRLDTGERKVVVRKGTFPRYLPSGHLVFARANALYAVRLDPRTLSVEWSPVEVAGNVYVGTAGYAEMDVSRNGTLVSMPADAAADGLVLSWVDRAGTGQPLGLAAADYRTTLKISPDGRRAVLRILSTPVVLDLDRLAVTKLLLPARSTRAAWSGDGRRFFVGLEKKRHFEVFSIAADGSGAEKAVVPSESSETPLQVSRDGSTLLTFRSAPDDQGELVTYRLGPDGGPRDARVVYRSKALDDLADLSPDARFVAYQSQESGRPEVYVRPTSGEDRRWQVSTDGGAFPVWSRDGREIFYLCGMQLLSAPVETRGGDLRLGTPKALFANHDVSLFDAGPDGRRFLVAEHPDPGASQRLDVTLNWLSEVRRKVEDARKP